MINIYDGKTTNFNNNGLVVLSECISCKVIEELNGSYELEIECPLDERKKWGNLLEGNIIKVDGQLFRIYRKIKNLKTIKINARHIFYDLMDNFLEDVRPTIISGAGALDYVLTNTQYPHRFTSMGDVGGSNTKYFVRKNPVEAIMGSDGIINTWGGELVRDNFTIRLLGARGLDRGVLVAYGKNIQGIEETLDLDGLCTRLMPIGKDGLLLTEKYIDSQYINNFSHPKIKVVEFTDIEDEATLRAAGQAYMLNSKCDIPSFNYKIDFLELSKTEEYKKYAVLERVYMGDTVTIKHSKLNINLKAKVIKITKNVLTGRIEKIELGSFKPNIATAMNNSINAVKQEIVQVKSDYQKAIDNATDLITGSKGGNVVIRQNDDGKPYEILIMDTNDVMTAENVWRWNLRGFGYSSTGVNGPYEVGITMDGSIVGKFITALEINGQQIIAGIIRSKNGNWNFDLDAETFNLGDKLIFDGANLALNDYATFTNLATKGQTIIDGGNIATNTISALSIKTSELIVGTNITMGANAQISWGNVTNQPTIPSQYTSTDVINAIKTTYIDSTNVWTITVKAQNIQAGEISGATIKTSSALNHIHLQNQWMDFYNGGNRLMSIGHMQFNSDGFPLTGYLPMIAFGELPKTGDLGDLNSVSAMASILYNNGNKELVMQNWNNGQQCGIMLGNNATVSFHGTVDFTGNAVIGLGNVPVVVKFL